MKNSTRTQKLALCGVLTALAMIFGYIESVISVPLPVPGIKVGLPNIAIITILYVRSMLEENLPLRKSSQVVSILE